MRGIQLTYNYSSVSSYRFGFFDLFAISRSQNMNKLQDTDFALITRVASNSLLAMFCKVDKEIKAENESVKQELALKSFG